MSDLYFYMMNLLQGTYTLRILQAFFDLIIKIAPYLVVSIFIEVGLLQIVNKRSIFFNIKNKFVIIIVGSLMGMVSPLPTYAAIPIGLSLIPLGLPIGAVMAFIISSPLINPSVFFLTITQLGEQIALARVAAAFFISVGGGFISEVLLKRFILPPQIGGRPKNQRPFWYEFWRSVLFFGKYFTISIFISAVIKALLSPQFITQILGQHIQRSLLIAIALGVPFYSCGGAAIPFVEVLNDMGMNKGAVLAFFIAGPATKLETMYVFKSLMGIKTFIFYLVLTLVGAYLSGLIFLFLT